MTAPMMKAALITGKGMEEAAAAEIKDIIHAKPAVSETVLEFSASPQDLCKLCYYSQSAYRIILLLHKQKIQEAEEASLGVDITPYLDGAKTFHMECLRKGDHTFTSVDIEKRYIALIGRAGPCTFVHDHADLAFFAYVTDDLLYFGIDLAGFDVSKRSYKLFHVPSSLKGPLAYTLLREIEYTADDTLLITASKDGVLPIEAAYFASGMSVNFYSKDKLLCARYPFLKIPQDFLSSLDQEPKKPTIHALDSSNHNLTLTKKNAKIAGVEKFLHFSRMELQWLDTKFEKVSVHKIMGILPAVSHNWNELQIKKLYREFFYQAEFILAPGGRVLTLTQKKDFLAEAAEEYHFSKDKEKLLFQGQNDFLLTVFKKG